MKKVCKIKNKLITGILMFIIIGLIIPPVKGFAADIGFAISPSKIYDERIDLGESKSFTFNVANKSKNVKDPDLFSMPISVEASIENELGEVVKNDNIIKVDIDKFSIGIEESQNVLVTIEIPKDEFLSGNYIIYMNFKQEAIDGYSLSGQTNIIRVPIYLYVGSESEYKNLKVDFEVDDTSVIYDTDTDSIFNILKNHFIELLNPLNVKDVISNIINTPIIGIKDSNNKISYDVNNDIYTILKNVLTEDEITDAHYVKYNKEWLSNKVNSSKLNSTNIVLMLDNNEEITINGTASNLSYIQEQLANISKDNPDITFQYLLENLKVPKNITYEQKYPILISSVKNTGDLTISVDGKYDYIKDNAEKIEEAAKIPSQTIQKGESASIRSFVSNKNLQKGNYVLNGSLYTNTVEKNITGQVSIINIRTYFIIACIIFEIVYLLLGLFVIKVFYKKIKTRKIEKSKKNKDINDEKSNKF